MQTPNRLRPIAEGDFPGDLLGEIPPHPPENPPEIRRSETVATSMLLTSLRALSQRALIAISTLVGGLFVLATAGSAFWLWLVTMPNPTVLQLIGLTLYATLILLLNWLVLRRI